MPLRSWRQSVLDAGEVVVFDNLRDAFGDVLGKDACEQIKRQLGITKVAAVPLVMEGEVFGLSFFFYSGHEPDVEILELTAGHCTLALKELASGEETTRYGGIDPVTWVHSRGNFLESLEAEVVRSRRYSRALSLVLFDVDDFSQFNTTYGHTMGDRLLRTFAMTLAGSIAAPELVARYGADELVLLLPETNRMTAVELTASIVRKLNDLSLFETEDGEQQGISASAAIVSYPEDGATRDELLTAVEIAIEQSKEERRERMKPERDRTPVSRLRLVNRRHGGTS
jgi:diguanylate cyclase (GGDEF)-like protein